MKKAAIKKEAVKKDTIKKEESVSCKYPHKKLWCVSIMAVVIVILTWLPTFGTTWSRAVVTVLAALIFARSMMVNCCKDFM